MPTAPSPDENAPNAPNAAVVLGLEDFLLDAGLPREDITDGNWVLAAAPPPLPIAPLLAAARPPRGLLPSPPAAAAAGALNLMLYRFPPFFPAASAFVMPSA